MAKVYYYQSETDDLVTSKNQNYQIKDDYIWIHTNLFYRLLSNILYGIIIIVSFVYCKLILRVHIEGREKLKGYKAYFIYGNHTQTVMDPLLPLLVNLPHKTNFIAAPANLGIPIIGKILPMAGALVIPGKVKDFSKLKEAVNYYNQKNCIMIYPEAHVWPYYTKIRPFSSASFHYPVENNKPVFVQTTTYQLINGKKKKIVYIDGPIMPQENLTKKENIKYLRDEVFNLMSQRAALSNWEEVQYIRKD